MTGYSDFLKKKLITTMPTGFEPFALPDRLYSYQQDLVQWACKRGKASLFCMTGTGKTIMQSSWADAVQSETSGNVLILAPLAVAKQTVREAKKIGINVNYCRNESEIKRGIELWSNPGDVVYDPFSGIGSTQYVALKNGRKGLGSELKESYFKQAVLNCKAAFNDTMPLFAEANK